MVKRFVDSSSLFSMPNFDWGKNVIIFGVDMSSSVHIDNKNRDILILDKRPTQGLDYTTLTAEAEHSISFSRFQIFLLMQATNFYLLMPQKYISSNQKNLK